MINQGFLVNRGRTAKAHPQNKHQHLTTRSRENSFAIVRFNSHWYNIALKFKTVSFALPQTILCPKNTGKALYAGTGSLHLISSHQFPPVPISPNRPESIEMLSNGLRCATHGSTYSTWRDQKVRLRPGNRRDPMRSVRTRVMHRSHVLAGAREQQLAVCPFGVGLGIGGEGEWGWWGGGGGAGVGSRTGTWCRSALHAAWGVRLIFLALLLSAYSSAPLLPRTHNTLARGAPRSTHSLVSGNLNAGVSYTGKTPVLQKWKGEEEEEEEQERN